jgi:hypothetical protein
MGEEFTGSIDQSDKEPGLKLSEVKVGDRISVITHRDYTVGINKKLVEGIEGEVLEISPNSVTLRYDTQLVATPDGEVRRLGKEGEGLTIKIKYDKDGGAGDGYSGDVIKNGKSINMARSRTPISEVKRL